MLEEYLEWLQGTGGNAFPKVAQNRFPDGVLVSTAFMSTGAQTWTDPPCYFETMILGGPEDGYQFRTSTWEGAEAVHQQALELVQRHYPEGTKSDFSSDGPSTRFDRLSKN